MAELAYADLQTTASAALGDASTRITAILDDKQVNAEVGEILAKLVVDIDADQTVVDEATEPA